MKRQNHKVLLLLVSMFFYSGCKPAALDARQVEYCHIKQVKISVPNVHENIYRITIILENVKYSERGTPAPIIAERDGEGGLYIDLPRGTYKVEKEVYDPKNLLEFKESYQSPRENCKLQRLHFIDHQKHYYRLRAIPADGCEILLGKKVRERFLLSGPTYNVNDKECPSLFLDFNIAGDCQGYNKVKTLKSMATSDSTQSKTTNIAESGSSRIITPQNINEYKTAFWPILNKDRRTSEDTVQIEHLFVRAKERGIEGKYPVEINTMKAAWAYINEDYQEAVRYAKKAIDENDEKPDKNNAYDIIINAYSKLKNTRKQKEYEKKKVRYELVPLLRKKDQIDGILTIKRNVRIRSSPDTRSSENIVFKREDIEEGNQFNLCGETERNRMSWYDILLNDAKHAYVSKNFCQVESKPIKVRPITDVKPYIVIKESNNRYVIESRNVTYYSDNEFNFIGLFFSSIGLSDSNKAFFVVMTEDDSIALIERNHCVYERVKRYEGLRLKDYYNRRMTYNIPEKGYKFYFLNFWASDCKPCIEEFDDLRALQGFFAEKVKFYSITGDEAESLVKKIVERKKLKKYFLVCYDSGDELLLMFSKKTELPFSVLMDHRGKILLKFVGKRNWLSPDIKNMIQKEIAY